MLLEGGLRVCNDAILLDFWCSFAGILILSCGIVVLQNQAVCGVWKFSGNFNAVCSFLCYSVRCLNVFLFSFAVFIPPLHCTPPSFSLAFYQGRIKSSKYGMSHITVKKISRVVYLDLRADFSCWCCFLIVLHCLAVCLAVPLNQDSKICNTVQSTTGKKSHWPKLS